MHGYAKLSSLMGAYPEVAILRRFGALNARNLLYLQAELLALETDLGAYETEDESRPERADFARDWYTLSQSAIANDESGDQWRTVLKIRESLKQYSPLSSLLEKIKGNASGQMNGLMCSQTKPSFCKTAS